MMKRLLLLALVGMLVICGVVSAAFVQLPDGYGGGINTSTFVLLHPTGVDGSTTFNDSSYNNHNLVPYWNATISNISWSYWNFTPGKQTNGTSIYFDGTYRTNVSISGNKNLSLGTKNFTIDFWVLPFSDSNKYIFESGVETHGLQMFVRATDRVRFGSQNNSVSTGNYQFPTGSTPKGKLTHIAFERVGTTARGYVDGVEVALSPTTEFGTNVMPETSTWNFGNSNVSSNAFFGYISEFRLTYGADMYPSVSSPNIKTASYSAWNDTTISGEYFKDKQNISYGFKKNYTLYARNVTNISFITTNLTFPKKDVKIDNVYFNNSQFGTLVAILNNASATGFVNVNITNTSWLASAPDTGIALFDAQFNWTNTTYKNPANITVEATSFWNGNYSVVNSGNFYFRDNSDGDIFPFYIPPHANFTQNRTSGVSPVPPTITENSEWTEGATYWNLSFGDGTFTFLKNDTYIHTYTSPGVYIINLTVVNPSGRSSYLGNFTAYLTSPESLTADFTTQSA